jgi:ribosomal protein S18 acetylase RimI-like enzyme
MFDGYQIRPARRCDIHRLPQIERDAARRFAIFDMSELVYGPSLPLELLEQRQTCGQLWVALDRNKKAVGFAVASILDGHGHLDELDVLVRHGRRGLGTRLVKAVCRWAYRAKLRGVTLSTLRTVPWNAPFYSRLGFEVVPETELSEDLVRLRQLEALAGLQVTQRVIMRRAF